MTHFLQRIVGLYASGFRTMTVGRSLWLIIAIKIIIIFGVLKLFFFPDLLAVRYDNDADRSAHVLEQLTAQSTPNVSDRQGEPHD